MNSRRVSFVIILLLWIVVLGAAAVGLQLDFSITIVLGLAGLLIIRGLFRTPASAARKRSTMPPSYETVARKLDAIESEMRRIGYWQDMPLKPEQYDFRAAFAGDTMAFSQWLQFIFVPNVRAIIAQRGSFPASSQVGAYAVREFDGDDRANPLISLLSEFDNLF